MDTHATDAPGAEGPCWVDSLKNGDEAAWRLLWRAYARRLRGLARHYLLERGNSSHGADDVLNEAFLSFWNLLRANRVPPSDTLERLWPLLATITRRKAGKKVRFEHAARRDRQRLQRDGDGADPSAAPLAGALSRESAPDEAAEDAEHLAEALARVSRNDREELLLLLWLSGAGPAKLAEELDETPAFVTSRLAILLKRLQKVIEDLNREDPAEGH